MVGNGDTKDGNHVREPSGTEAQTMMVRTVQNLADRIDRVDQTANQANTAAAALKEVLDLHLSHYDEMREQQRVDAAEASAGRARLYDALENGIADLQKKIDANRSWTVALILSVAGALILLQAGVIGWLAIEFIDRPLGWRQGPPP